MAALSVSTDSDMMLKSFAEGVEHSSLSRRLGEVDAVTAWLRVEEAEALSKPQTRTLARILLNACGRAQYLERVWIAGLHRVMASAAGSERCPMFTPICVTNLAGILPSAGDNNSLLAILGIARILVETAAPSGVGEVAPEWIRKLIIAQASAHDKIGAIGDDDATRSRAVKTLHGCLKSRPHLLGQYLEVLTAESQSGDSLPALSAVYSFAAVLPLRKESVKECLLAVYIRDGLATKGGCDEYKLASFSSLLASLTPEDFSKVVQPVLEKLQKKNPDSILVAVSSLVKNVRIDLSAYVGVFIPPLLRQLRSAKEDVRKIAVELAGSLAERFADAEALKSMVLELCGVLGGKSGVMAQWYQRHSFFTALEVVRRGVELAQIPAIRCAELAGEAVSGLLPAVEKESHEDSRAVGLGCLTRWALLLDSLPPKLFMTLKNGLNSASRPTATIFAAAACELSGCPRLCPQLMPLFPDLLGRVELAAKKPNAFHPDAIFSSNVLLEIASLDEALEGKVKEAFPWRDLMDRGSFFFPDGLLAPQFAEVFLPGEAAGHLAPHVCTALCHVILLAARSIDRLGQADVPNLSEASSLALMQCMVLPSLQVRQTAIRTAAEICSLVSGAQVSLLRSCKQVVETNAEFAAARAGMKTLPSSGKDDAKFVLPPPNRFAAALFAILESSPPGSHLAIVLLLSHHPLVCHSRKGAASLWGRRVSLAFGGIEGVERHLEDEAVSASVISALVSALQGNTAFDRLSAQWALASLASCGAAGSRVVADRLFPALLDVLEDGKLRNLSETDVAIFFTPANVAYASPSNQKKPIAKASKNAIRRGKDAEEAEWEERVRAEIGSKSKRKDKSTGSEGGADTRGAGVQEMARVLEEESIIRARVGQVRHAALASLAGLQFGFRSCPELGFLSIPRALPVVLPMMGWKLLDDEVQDCVKALASTASKELPGCSSLIASSLRSLQLSPGAAGRYAVVNECLDSIFEACVSDVAGEIPLEQQTLALVFPILREVLNDPPSTAQCSRALKVVSIHANMEKGPVTDEAVLLGLRKFMIEGILTVICRFPQMEPAPDVVLASICTAPALDAGEWGPLLGGAGLLSEARHVRLACLESVMMMVLDGQALSGNPLVESRLWLSRFDVDQDNAELASEVWDARGAPLSAGFAAPLLMLLSDGKSHVRESAARALAGGILKHRKAGVTLLERLYSLYSAHVPPPPTEPNESKLDMEKFFAAPTGAEEGSGTRVDTGWPTRAGVALTLKALGEAQAFDEDSDDTSLQDAFSFLVENGLADYSARVRGHMLAAGVAVISAFGGGRVLQFLRPCEAVMAKALPRGEDAQRLDWRREGVVVFMGCAAKHLDKEDPKVLSIVETLIGALATPSEAVQIAVSDCLAPLMKIPVVKERGPELLKELLSRCVGGRSYGERRGAAFGVAAVVKGLGIATIKRHQVISTLEEACKRTSFQGKQGALCAFECMCVRLGLLFEPYVIVILPHLLKCFGDSSNYVREAAHDCARAIMSKLSAHGVKLILPAILKSLSDPAWRTKQGAIELLGSMAYCAPRQLADSLPMIVPKLTDAFADTHPKVRDSGRKALEDIGSVIRNPEVASLSMTLMSALSDPSKYTRGALEALLACEFMHSIDAPSLALMVPVLQRGLKDRSADVKRKAALITGNTCTMISEAKDLLPYLSVILPGLKGTCVDPIPDVRATAAKALAALVRGMGEDKVGDVVPWLIETLKADSSSSERSGGAQALSEVLVVLGVSRASSVMCDLLPLAAHPKGSVREGVLWVLCFLPGAMGKDFAVIIPSSLPVVLAGLSDEVEAVREVALRSGQVLVSTHGRSHANQLLPALENGLFDDNWRIRRSSVQLLGDLLYLIGDTKEVALDEGAAEDDARGSTRAGEAIEEALGLDRRNSVLASLYLIRSDTSAVVRQSALQVWKTVVPNTPKALREILPLLISQIVSALASGNPDKRTVAGRALGDIVKKLGDQVLPEVVPFLREGLEAGDENMRQGVCLGLAEIMDCATPRQVEEFIDTLVPAIQDALCDPSAGVREQSAHAFHSLYKAVGIRSIEHVVPSLLKELGQEGDSDYASSARERAVFGLKEVIQLRPRDLLPYLIPRLVSVPISIAHARALGAVAEVTGGSIHSHLAVVIPAVVAELARADVLPTPTDNSGREECLNALKEAASTLVSRVETVGVNWLCNEMTRPMSSNDPKQRQWSAWLVEMFLRGTEAVFEDRIPQILKELLQRLVDTEQAVLLAVWSALKAMNARVPAEELTPHLTFARSIIASIVSDARHRKGGGGAGAEYQLPGVNIPKGLEPLLPMYQQGLMYGSPEVREAAASGIGELVDVTSLKYLQPFLIKITGPLIRIVGDRFPPGVKAAILQTLGLLLRKGGPSLKPFVPQLQTTFVKALGDASRIVRSQGRIALGELMGLTTRVDPLISDLASGASSSGETAVKETMLGALAEVLERSGSRASTSAIQHAIQGLEAMQDEPDDAVRGAAAKGLGCAMDLARRAER